MIPRVPQGDDPGLSAAEAYADRKAGGPPREVFSPRRGGAIDEVRIYALDQPAAWLLVTLGLADLGFELTLRLSRNDEELPLWAVDFLGSLAAYARTSGHGFAAGHQIDLRGPIKLASDSKITAAAVAVDPVLAKLGKVEFLRIVGVTADELELCRSWRTAAVVALLAGRDPPLTTVLDRPSLFDDPALREAAEAGVAAEGSSLEELGVGSLAWRWRGRGKWRVLVVTLGAGAATALGPALRRRLNHPGASFAVIGDPGEVRFVVIPTSASAVGSGLTSGDGAGSCVGSGSGTGLTSGGGPGSSVGSGSGEGWRLEDDDAVVVEVGLGTVEALAGLFSGKTGSGSLPTVAGLRFTVIP